MAWLIYCQGKNWGKENNLWEPKAAWSNKHNRILDFFSFYFLPTKKNFYEDCFYPFYLSFTLANIIPNDNHTLSNSYPFDNTAQYKDNTKSIEELWRVQMTTGFCDQKATPIPRF